MKAVKFECPKCHQPIETPEDLLGSNVMCPTCRAEFVAGAEEGIGSIRLAHGLPLKPAMETIDWVSRHRAIAEHQKKGPFLSRLAIILVIAASFCSAGVVFNVLDGSTYASGSAEAAKSASWASVMAVCAGSGFLFAVLVLTCNDTRYIV